MITLIFLKRRLKPISPEGQQTGELLTLFEIKLGLKKRAGGVE